MVVPGRLESCRNTSCFITTRSIWSVHGYQPLRDAASGLHIAWTKRRCLAPTIHLAIAKGTHLELTTAVRALGMPHSAGMGQTYPPHCSGRRIKLPDERGGVPQSLQTSLDYSPVWFISRFLFHCLPSYHSPRLLSAGGTYYASPSSLGRYSRMHLMPS